VNTDTDHPLRALDREAAPPPALKDRVIRSLRRRGLLRRRGRPGWRAPGAIAAALALFSLGWAVGRRPVSLPSAVDSRPAFALLLYEGGDFRRDQSEAESIAEYGAWAATLRARGTLVKGEALDTAARLLRPTPQGGGGLVDTRDAVSDQGVLAGFFIIHARDAAEALAIARTCPHLRHGGRIALRPVIPTS